MGPCIRGIIIPNSFSSFFLSFFSSFFSSFFWSFSSSFLLFSHHSSDRNILLPLTISHLYSSTWIISQIISLSHFFCYDVMFHHRYSWNTLDKIYQYFIYILSSNYRSIVLEMVSQSMKSWWLMENLSQLPKRICMPLFIEKRITNWILRLQNRVGNNKI